MGKCFTRDHSLKGMRWVHGSRLELFLLASCLLLSLLGQKSAFPWALASWGHSSGLSCLLRLRIWINRCVFLSSLWRHRLQQTAEQQRLHHCQEERGRPGHALPVSETHQRHLDLGRASHSAGEPELHGEVPGCGGHVAPAGTLLARLARRAISPCFAQHACFGGDPVNLTEGLGMPTELEKKWETRELHCSVTSELGQCPLSNEQLLAKVTQR